MDWDYDSSSFSFKIESVCFTTGLMDSQTTTTLFFQGHASCGNPANKVHRCCHEQDDFLAWAGLLNPVLREAERCKISPQDL
jgi:hypothetical protein